MNALAFAVILIVCSAALVFLILLQLGYFKIIFPALPSNIDGWISLFQGLVNGGSGFGSGLANNGSILGIIAFVGAILVGVWLLQEARKNSGGEKE